MYKFRLPEVPEIMCTDRPTEGQDLVDCGVVLRRTKRVSEDIQTLLSKKIPFVGDQAYHDVAANNRLEVVLEMRNISWRYRNGRKSPRKTGPKEEEG